MKLRFHNNSLRLRLSQTEAAHLGESGLIADQIAFPHDRVLSFSIESGDAAGAQFENDSIRVTAPREEIRRWLDTDQEGIHYESGPLKIAIEKDFQCLHKPTPADADAFPNPLVDKF